MLKVVWIASLGLALTSLLGLYLLMLHRYRKQRAALLREQRLNALLATLTEVDPEHNRSIPYGSILADLDLLPDAIKQLPKAAQTSLVQHFPITRLPELLQSPSKQYTPLLTARLLTLFDYHPDIETLLTPLLSGNFLVRNTAALWLIQRSPELDVEQCIKTLCRSGRPPHRKIIHQFQNRIQDNHYWLSLIKKAFDSHPVVLTALQCLKGRLSESQQQQLLPLTRHSHPDIRAQCWRTLGLTQSQLAKGGLSQYSLEPLWYVRTQMAFTAGCLEARAIQPQLSASLYSEVWWERYRAGQALVKILGPQALDRYLAVGDRAGRIAQVIVAEQREMIES